MRGPLLSGALGSAATVRRVCQIARERGPAVVLSALWLAQALAREIPVTVLIEGHKRKAGARAVRRAARAKARLAVVTAGEGIPLVAAVAGCIIVENVGEIADDSAAADFLGRLGPALRAGGLVVALDATSSVPREARVAGLFLAAALTSITQERPREGALLTIAGPPPAAAFRRALPAAE